MKRHVDPLRRKIPGTTSIDTYEYLGTWASNVCRYRVEPLMRLSDQLPHTRTTSTLPQLFTRVGQPLSHLPGLVVQ